MLNIIIAMKKIYIWNKIPIKKRILTGHSEILKAYESKNNELQAIRERLYERLAIMGWSSKTVK